MVETPECSGTSWRLRIPESMRQTSSESLFARNDHIAKFKENLSVITSKLKFISLIVRLRIFCMFSISFLIYRTIWCRKLWLIRVLVHTSSTVVRMITGPVLGGTNTHTHTIVCLYGRQWFCFCQNDY